MFLRRPRPPLPGTSRGQGPNPQPSPLSKPVVSQAADPPLGRGVLRVLRTARATKPTAGRAPQNWGSRGSARPGSRSSPRATAESQRERARRAATRNGRTAQRARYRAKKKHALARAPLRALVPPRPPKPQARPSPTRGAEAREPRDVLRTEAAPRSPGPSGSGPPAPARRCVGWACCPRPTALLHSRPHQSPHPATSPPPLPPLYPPAPLHRLGPRFCHRCSKTDRIFSSQLPGRHLTFNPHGQWEPNASLARVEASDPARATAQT